MGEYWTAFNIIFRKSSSLKVIQEIGIFSEFILENYFAKYLDSSIVHFQSKIQLFLRNKDLDLVNDEVHNHQIVHSEANYVEFTMLIFDDGKDDNDGGRNCLWIMIVLASWFKSLQRLMFKRH